MTDQARTNLFNWRKSINMKLDVQYRWPNISIGVFNAKINHKQIWNELMRSQLALHLLFMIVWNFHQQITISWRVHTYDHIIHQNKTPTLRLRQWNEIVFFFRHSYLCDNFTFEYTYNVADNSILFLFDYLTFTVTHMTCNCIWPNKSYW